MKQSVDTPAVLLLSLLLFVFTPAARAQTSGTVRSLTRAIDRELSSNLFSRTLAGVEISDVRTGKVLYRKNADLFLRPASNTKLFTTAAALLALPDSFAFTTVLYARQAENGGTDIWLRGAGDPLFGMDDIATMTAALASAGTRSIRSLTLDGSMFDSLYYGEGWMWDDEMDAGIPYLSAFPFSGNRFVVAVHAQNARSLPEVTVTPDGPSVRVERNVRVGAATRLRIERVPRCNTLRIRGTIAAGDRESEALSMWKPEEVLHDAIEKHLREANLLDGELHHGDGPVPADAREIARVSHPLDTILSLVNKNSDNLAAECVLKSMAYHLSRAEGSARAGLAVQKSVLTREGLDSSGIALVDGSGISFYNLVTPSAIGRLLRAMWRRPEFDRYKKSLAIGGTDGTIRGRLGNTPHANAVVAKTGTIRGVSALSGYVLPPHGQPLAFVMLMQNFRGDARPYRDAQDRIVRHLLRFSTSAETAVTPSR